MGLNLIFNNISNANTLINGSSSDVSAWNAFFQLPTNGSPFTSVAVNSNTVSLSGGVNIHLRYAIFRYNLSLLSVDDADNCIISADNECFMNCTSVTSINLPALATAGNECFYMCTAALSFNLPALASTGINCFYMCTAATSINTPTLITTSLNSFYGCSLISSFDLPNLITAGDECFYGCSGATSFNLPVMSNAGYNCFGNCSSITTLSLPSLTVADSNCFGNCSILTSLDLPALTTADDSCFIGCSSVTSFNLPNCTTIGDMCFMNCLGATAFNLPKCDKLGTTVSNNNVFYGTNGKYIYLTIPASLMTCNSGNPDGDIQYLQGANYVNITQIYLPLSLTFSNISYANSLIGGLPSDVAVWNAFFQLPTNGTPFTSVTISGNTVSLSGGTSIHLRDYIFNGQIQLLSFNDAANCITTAGSYCFNGCTSATSLNLPALINAGNNCFNGCTSAALLNLPALINAADDCFNGCTPVLSFDLPSLTTAGNNCFYGCSGATSFNLPSLTFAGSYCFGNCSSASAAFNLPFLSSASDGCFYNCKSATLFNLPSCENLGSTVGGDQVFEGITGNTVTLTVPTTLQTVNNGYPDGDIQYLSNNNSAIVNYVETTTTTTTTTLPPTTTTTTTKAPLALVGTGTSVDGLTIFIVFNEDIYDVTYGNLINNLTLNANNGGMGIISATISGSTLTIQPYARLEQLYPITLLIWANTIASVDTNYILPNTGYFSVTNNTTTTTTTTTTLPPVLPQRKVQPKLFADRDPLNTDNANSFVSVGQVWHNNVSGDEFYHKFNGEWVPLGGGNIVVILYSDLYALHTNGGLVAFNKYLLTDYMTTYNQPISNAYIETGVIEPLLLTAISGTKLSPICDSILYPQDIIYYDIEDRTGGLNDSGEGFTKGKIYRRIDTMLNNDIGTDWRHIKYRRWMLNVTNLWISGSTYNVGDIVTYNNRIYIAPKALGNNVKLSEWIPFGFNNGEYASLSENGQIIVINNTEYTISSSKDYQDLTLFSGYSNNTYNNRIIGTRLYNIVIKGDIFSSNTFGNNNNSITFGNYNSSITFGNNNSSITFGNYNNAITFGSNDNAITFGDYNNTIMFGSNNNAIVHGNYNRVITFGNNNNAIVFGNYNDAITFGNYNNAITFGDHYINYIVNNCNFVNSIYDVPSQDAANKEYKLYSNIANDKIFMSYIDIFDDINIIDITILPIPY